MTLLFFYYYFYNSNNSGAPEQVRAHARTREELGGAFGVKSDFVATAGYTGKAESLPDNPIVNRLIVK
jgi:hypothetical protein